jgi:hypothetical protein
MGVSKFFSHSNTLKFDDVLGVILSKEMQQKITGEISGNALNMESRGGQHNRGKGSGNYRNSRKGRSKSKVEKIVCYNCGKK